MPGDAALLTVVSNVTDEDQVEQYVRQALDTFGRIDCFFNNAGIEGSRTGAWSLIPDLSVEDFNEILSVNCTGVFLGLKHVIPALLLSGGGAVVNTSSINGLKGAWGQVAYTASKHAVSAMTAVAAKEWGRRNIRVNAIAPGAIEGRMNRDFVEILQAKGATHHRTGSHTVSPGPDLAMVGPRRDRHPRGVPLLGCGQLHERGGLLGRRRADRALKCWDRETR